MDKKNTFSNTLKILCIPLLVVVTNCGAAPEDESATIAHLRLDCDGASIEPGESIEVRADAADVWVEYGGTLTITNWVYSQHAPTGGSKDGFLHNRAHKVTGLGSASVDNVFTPPAGLTGTFYIQASVSGDEAGTISSYCQIRVRAAGNTAETEENTPETTEATPETDAQEPTENTEPETNTRPSTEEPTTAAETPPTAGAPTGTFSAISVQWVGSVSTPCSASQAEEGAEGPDLTISECEYPNLETTFVVEALDDPVGGPYVHSYSLGEFTTQQGEQNSGVATHTVSGIESGENIITFTVRNGNGQSVSVNYVVQYDAD